MAVIGGWKCDSVEVKAYLYAECSMGKQSSVLRTKYLRQGPEGSLRGNENLHISLKANIVQ
ncbi:hypothetical protein T06_9633 [Trichinella sp. T6]|nr:hypothetical protein T06_9633 [Trichinella sp. T6]